MADFSTPFSDSADKRYPTTNERQNGFPCGAADQQLFNGLFYRIESEIGEVISHAGLTPNDADLTQLRQAIDALIAAATGGGETEGYLLTAQARARLPIFPEVQTSDGKIVVTAPSTGTVRLPGGVTFLHRGIFPITTSQTDFPTDASKIYHLRWDPTNGFVLNDLASGAYNPEALAETDTSFDSTFDDMLVARIVTNSSNVATITNLINLVRMQTTMYRDATVGDAGANGIDTNFTFDFARTPMCLLESTWPPGTYRDSDLKVQIISRTRYGGTVRSWNWTAVITGSNHNSPGYNYNVLAV